MLTSNATTNTIAFFLYWVKAASPAVRPAVIMTDRDQAQIGALQEVYPDSRTFLCTWHVLRAMRSHFVTNEFPDLWEKIKIWAKTDNLAEYLNLWDEILFDLEAPLSFLKYLVDEWVKVPHLWSRVFRKNRSIFEEGDTNMLIEAYVVFSH
jgi:hypothetical protein